MKNKTIAKQTTRQSSSTATRAPEPLLQLKHFAIAGLFGRSTTQDIDFPVLSEEPSTPSIVILHGRNGVGKTTILRMLEGLLRLDFDVFRQIPFDSCSLSFDSNDRIEVKARRKGQLSHLEVLYSGMQVLLHPEHSRPLSEEDAPKVEEFRLGFFKRTANITFEFIDTERLHRTLTPASQLDPDMAMAQFVRQRVVAHSVRQNPKARAPVDQTQSLAARVRRFIRDAQVNYRAFFSRLCAGNCKGLSFHWVRA